MNPMSEVLRKLNLESFSKHQGNVFQIHHSGESIDVRLEEVESRRTKDFDKSSGRREPFALLFVDPKGSAESYLPQGTYRFVHEALGDLELFIVPIGPGGEGAGMCYEAQFT